MGRPSCPAWGTRDLRPDVPSAATAADRSNSVGLALNDGAMSYLADTGTLRQYRKGAQGRYPARVHGVGYGPVSKGEHRLHDRGADPGAALPCPLLPGRRYRISAYTLMGRKYPPRARAIFTSRALIEGLAIAEAKPRSATAPAAGGVLVGAAVYLSAPGVSGSQTYVLKGFSTICGRPPGQR